MGHLGKSMMLSVALCRASSFPLAQLSIKWPYSLPASRRGRTSASVVVYRNGPHIRVEHKAAILPGAGSSQFYFESKLSDSYSVLFYLESQPTIQKY